MLLKILHGFGRKDECVRERVQDYIAYDFEKYKPVGDWFARF